MMDIKQRVLVNCGIFLLLVSYVAGQASCRCAISSECSTFETVGCSSCMPGWSGRNCQTQNVARGKTTFQTSVHIDCNVTPCRARGSTNAVDGDRSVSDLSQCAQTTSIKEELSWRVEFGRSYVISRINTYFPIEGVFLRGLRVMVGDQDCFNLTTSTIPTTIECVTPVEGTNVQLILPPSFVDRYFAICEVEVYVCGPLWYGRDCNQKCSCFDETEACNPVTGACTSGCRTGFAGTDCKTCAAGFFGPYCNERCGICQDNEPCDAQTGACSKCAPGWGGPKCDTSCEAGKFGAGCTTTCGKCLNSDTCDRKNGSCPSGCDPGYMGPFCFERCAPGKYGVDCLTTCSSNCQNDDICSIDTGNCPNGCASGWTGLRCDQECQAGTYGPGCVDTCGNCKDGEICNSVTGNCPNACEPGWAGIDCKKGCPDWTFGQGCGTQCGSCNLGPCDKVTGECSNGCQPGFKMPICAQACDDGTYGQDCQSVCGTCKNAAPCDKRTGQCTDGCGPGRMGIDCTTGCPQRKYGEDCALDCGNCRDGAVCEPVTGACPLGCIPGYNGSVCQSACLAGTYGLDCLGACGQCSEQSVCDFVDGTCPSGCSAGWTGDTCTQACTGKTFGPNCVLLCGNCKNEVDCNRVTGSCPDGCAPGYSSDLCDQECEPGSFGQDCSGTCGNCVNREVCNHIDGHCPGGCAPGWHGQHCSIECPDGSYGDGCLLQCANCKTDTVCSKTNGSCPIGCAPGWTMIMCDAKCADGRYGDGCSFPCGNCKDREVCNHMDGSCPGACEPGWIGILCDTECDDGKYGLNCAADCGSCKTGTVCNKDSGLCPSGCTDGYTGSNCLQQCPSGFYGEGCSMACGNCNPPGICNHISGSCDVCQPGWKGDNCLEKCAPGFYGLGCASPCGQCDPEGLCNEVTGSCDTCKPGWKGGNCLEECENGKYGLNCAFDCGACKAGTACNKDQGSCPDGCQAGYTPPYCFGECPLGFYGDDCTQPCGHCDTEGACHAKTGFCNTCKPGWKGDKCVDECEDGKYGLNCAFDCGDCKTGTVCSKDQGVCPDGCNNGSTGANCLGECPSKKWGSGCVSVCGNCLGDASCHIATGHCPGGCEPSWTAPLCVEACPDGRYGINCSRTCGKCNNDLPCDKVSGVCPNKQCQDGFAGELCLTAAAPSPSLLLIIALVFGILGACLLIFVIILCCVRRNKKKRYDEDGILPPLHNDKAFKDNPDAQSDVSEGTRSDLDELGVNPDNEESSFGTHTLNQRMTLNAVDPNNFLKTDNADDTGLDIKSVDSEYNWPSDEDSTTAFSVYEIKDHIDMKMAAGGFENEFMLLPRGMRFSHAIGNLPANRHKNRYPLILPYDDSRVILNRKDLTDTDYINASYIDGFRTLEEYIATQGPIEDSVNDFWRMIWEKNVCKIIMLGRTKEAGKAKCFKYWPDVKDGKTYGTLSITCIKIVGRAHYILREFYVYDHQAGEKRVVTHFQFLSWPEASFPSPCVLAGFIKQTNKMESHRSPVVVHCSTGIGRTGSFIAVNAMAEQAGLEPEINVFKYVCRMRLQRPEMVRTRAQYAGVHQTLHEMIASKHTLLTSSQLMEKYQTTAFKSLSDTSRPGLEFQVLQEMLPFLTDWQTEIARRPENLEKNRSMDVLPGLLHLVTLKGTLARPNPYINAVFLPSVLHRRGFIVTQQPLYHSIDQFWTMVHEQESVTIVSLMPSDLPRKDIKDFGDYTPGSAGEVLSVGKFEILHKSSVSTREEIPEQTLILRTKGQSDFTPSRHVKIFTIPDWPQDQDTPPNKDVVLSLLDLLVKRQKDAGQHPVIVHCLDGSSRSGLFCAVSNVISRLKMDKEVDVFLLVREIQSIRPTAISSFSQYCFCYEMARKFLKNAQDQP